VAGDLAKWLEDKGIEHLRGAPYHPQRVSNHLTTDTLFGRPDLF
jgi:hypothetical protein